MLLKKDVYFTAIPNTHPYRIPGQGKLDLSKGYISLILPRIHVLMKKGERHCFNLETADGVEKYKVLQASYQQQS